MKVALRFWLLILVIPILLPAQSRISETLPFGIKGEKSFSIYLPSEFDPQSPTTMIVAFHPFGTPDWNHESWRDLLIPFAEENQAILLCPDGGKDGRIDDQEDLDFTQLLIDSMINWYSIDPEHIYGMGFSWGARALLKSALDRPYTYNGLLLVGIAVEGAGEFRKDLHEAYNLPCYFIHGKQDALEKRFYPIKDELMVVGACTEFQLLEGVGHTIYFRGREKILMQGLTWLKQVKCQQPTHFREPLVRRVDEIVIYPNPTVKANNLIQIDAGNLGNKIQEVRVLNEAGILLRVISDFDPRLPIAGLASGVYSLVFLIEDKMTSRKVVIR